MDIHTRTHMRLWHVEISNGIINGCYANASRSVTIVICNIGSCTVNAFSRGITVQGDFLV